MSETKYCKRCDSHLSRELFTESSARYDGLQSYCRECMKLYRKEYYERNKQSHLDRNKKSMARMRLFILERKSASCSDCGVTYPGEPWLMEFDHRQRSDKREEINMSLRSGSMKRLIEELDKCDLVCVVCHRRRTAQSLEWSVNRHESYLNHSYGRA